VSGWTLFLAVAGIIGAAASVVFSLLASHEAAKAARAAELTRVADMAIASVDSSTVGGGGGTSRDSQGRAAVNSEGVA
jgi:hypothetical protein